MGLFYKREMPESSVRYNSGLEQTKLIIGLGNIGKEYAKTRHNAGFMAVDAFVSAKGGDWTEKKALKSLVADLRDGQTRIIVIKPTTMMNLSGEAAQAVQRFFKIKNSDTLVIYDELDIKFGSLRIGNGGSSAGHNGMKSLISHIGEDFDRIRVGIGPKKPKEMDTADFVLQQFGAKEQPDLSVMTLEVNSIISEYLYSGLQAETRKYLL